MKHTVVEITRLLQKGVLQKSDIVYLMVLFRILVEKENAKSSFPFLNLYSTWVVHPELSRNSTCLNILIDLTKIIATPDRISTKLVGPAYSDYFQCQINHSLGLQNLREEINKFASIYNFPECNFEVFSVWRNFVLILTSCLVDRPIRIPQNIEKNKNAMTTYKIITKLSDGDPSKEVVEFEFIHISSIPFRLADDRCSSSEIMWRMMTKKGVQLISPLQII